MSSNAGCNPIIADGRWCGPHGIGRFASEVLSRLHNTTVFTNGPKPLSLSNLPWQMHKLSQWKKQHRVYFTPGFNPAPFAAMPFVITIHDLIHLQFPGKAAQLKKAYYKHIIKPSARAAANIITVSQYSKEKIIEWAKIPAEKICVVTNGVSEHIAPHGAKHAPGYHYILHVGNTKAHKNVTRLIQAFSMLPSDSTLRLILTGQPDDTLKQLCQSLHLEHRIIWSGVLSEAELAAYYRGAMALAFPSLYEGFGLPVIEAMASGIPVLTSNVTSLPEVAGDSALLVDPYSVESIAAGLESICSNETLRQTLIARGLERAKAFSWDITAKQIQKILNPF